MCLSKCEETKLYYFVFFLIALLGFIMGFRDGTPVHRVIQLASVGIFFILFKTVELRKIDWRFLIILVSYLSLLFLELFYTPEFPRYFSTEILFIIFGIFISSFPKKTPLIVYTFSVSFSIIGVFFYSFIENNFLIKDRLWLLGENPNIIAINLSCYILILVGLLEFWFEKRFARWILLGFIFLLNALLILTVSRTSILALFATLICIFFVFCRQRMYKQTVWVVLILAISSLFSSQFLSNNEKGRVEDLSSISNVSDGFAGNPMASRIVIFDATISMIKESTNKNIIFGIGEKKFQSMYNNYVMKHQKEIMDAYNRTPEFNMPHSHNIILHLLWNNGIVGCILFFGLFIFLLVFAFIKGEWIPFSIIMFLLINGMADISLSFLNGVFMWMLPVGMLGYSLFFKEKVKISS